MEQEEKRVIAPMVNAAHTEENTGLRIAVNLAGAAKDSLELEMGKEGFCVKGEGEDFKYETCYMLAHRVKAEDAKARFESGLLTINVPFEDTMHGHKVVIE